MSDKEIKAAEYEEFVGRSPEAVVLAIFDKLGVKLAPWQIEYVGY